MSVNIFIAMTLFVYPLIRGEESTTLLSLPIEPSPHPDETNTDGITFDEVPTDAVTVSSHLDDITTKEFEELFTTDLTDSGIWYNEWPDSWRTPHYFPFYSKLEDRHDLLKRLMLKYNKHILPYSGNSLFEISINISLVAVGEIDEIEEKMSTVLWLSYQWKDDNIKWNQNENYITDLTLGWIDVWKPVLRIDNPHADSSNRQATERSFDSVIYTSNGTASFDEMMVTRTTCDLDMTFYPFDIQHCRIKLSVVGSSKFPFKLNIKLADGLTSSDTKHGSWKLLYQGTKVFSTYFQIELKFERRPLFILLNILLPIIVIALLTPTVFVLPKKSGERVGFAITMLLALSVYMTIVSDHLPQNSEPMPLILIMMFIWYIIDAIIVFIVILNSRINRMKESKPLPRWLRSFIRITRKLLYGKKIHHQEVETIEETEGCIDNENIAKGKGEEVTDERQQAEGKQENYIKDIDDHTIIENEEVTWHVLSHCIDRWCFLICYFIKITLPVTFFVVMKCESKNQK